MGQMINRRHPVSLTTYIKNVGLEKQNKDIVFSLS